MKMEFVTQQSTRRHTRRHTWTRIGPELEQANSSKSFLVNLEGCQKETTILMTDAQHFNIRTNDKVI